MPKPRTTAYLLLTATVLVWGVTFTLVKTALADASPPLFNFLRFALATLVLAALNHRQLRSLTAKQFGAGAAAGLFLALGYEFQTLGLQWTDPGRSAFITGMVVIFVPILTLVPRFRPPGTKRPGLVAGAGAALAFCGLVLITTPAHVTAGTALKAVGRGDWLTLLCAVAFAGHVLTLGRASQAVPAGVLATLQIGVATLLVVLALPLEPQHVNLTLRLAMTLVICAVFATAAAFTIQSFAQSVLPPTHTVLILTLEPVFAWLTSLLLLHQGLDGRALAGAGLILAGIAAVEVVPAVNSPEIPA